MARADAFARGESTAAEDTRARMVAVKANRPEAASDERAWQLAQLTEDERRALSRLPALGADPSGPLGPGLLSQGILGQTIREIQTGLAG